MIDKLTFFPVHTGQLFDIVKQKLSLF